MQFSRIVFVGIVILQIFISCDNNEKGSLVTGAPSGDFSQPISTAPVSDGQPVLSGTGSGTGKLNPKHGEPGHRCDIAVGLPLNEVSPQLQNLQPVSTNPSASAAPAGNSLLNLPNLPANVNASSTNNNVALNPKHGEPGHRCDIAVGAPLNGSSAAAATPPTSAVPQISPSTVVPANNPQTGSNGSKALNPKHGEPGHRCDIAVGAPLSGTATTVSQPVTTTSATPNTSPLGTAAIPALQLPNTGNSGTARINPKHGEPGHRCDIAVGAAIK